MTIAEVIAAGSDYAAAVAQLLHRARRYRPGDPWLDAAWREAETARRRWEQVT